MTCQSLYLGFPTILPRSIDGKALGIDRNAGSRIRLVVPRLHPDKRRSECYRPLHSS